MSSSTVATRTWPDPRRLALGLVLSFALVLILAWAFGRQLVEAILPLARAMMPRLDDHFTIQYLGIEQGTQDTVVRLRTHLVGLMVVGSRVAAAHPGGFTEVVTAVGTLLQPLAIAVGFVGAWPGSLFEHLLRVGLAGIFALLFLLLDLPLTLYANVWDTYVYLTQQDMFSPLLMWHTFLDAGGRIAVGLLFALAAYGTVARVYQRTRGTKSV